jgi:hypothetical protein
LPPTADIVRPFRRVRFGPISDIGTQKRRTTLRIEGSLTTIIS